ncbi:MAG: 30S ribosomal protein S21 [Anaerolineae bacterium]|nr:30S ribosomal protein S21 [Anaerolineae bacterium]
MTFVVARPNEPAEKLIKRFRRKVATDRIMSEVKKRRYYVTKGEERRIAKRKGIRKARQRRRRAEHRWRRQ